MPHINRIRVNNVKYNFGTQFYDDFVMRFDGRNALYDLANGGGKSVLMLLLFQNLIPNCTLDDKQPVEKLFRTGEGSTTIHSLVEWKLDLKDIRDDYKYMLTGFCARKAKDDGRGDKTRDVASIDYFNYVIFYREYNDNDIINLPLQKGKERITYTGLKTYLKNLGHNDYHLDVHIFERKGEYQRFISRWGLYESSWEIIRGINKTEGHVRTWFETNFKTTRKVIEDLLIEEIIQKAFLVKAEGQTDPDMAKTLLEIKDRLLELSKKKEEISSYEYQIQALESFFGRIETLNELYAKENDFYIDLVKTYNTAANVLRQKEKNVALANKEKEQFTKRIGEMTRKLETVKIQQTQEQLKACEADSGKYEEKISQLRDTKARKQIELNMKQSANNYLEYVEYRKKAGSVHHAIENVSKDSSEVLSKLHAYVTRQKINFDNNKKLWNAQLDELKTELEAARSNEQNQELQCRELEKALAVNASEMERNTADEHKISENIRQLMKNINVLLIDDGARELRNHQIEIRNVTAEFENCQKKKADADLRIREIGLRREAIRVTVENLKNEEEQFLLFEKTWKQKKEKADKLMEVYNAADYHDLKAVIYERWQKIVVDLFEKREQIRKNKLFYDQLGDFQPMITDKALVDIMDYIRRFHGVTCMTGCDYIAGLEPKQRQEVLERIPYLPGCVIVKEGFSQLAGDHVLAAKEFGENIYPVIGLDMVLGSENLSKEEHVLFLTKNKKLFYDKNAVDQRRSQLDARRQTLEKELKRLEDTSRTYMSDIEYLGEFIVDYHDKYVDKLADVTQKRGQLTELTKEDSRLEGDIGELRKHIKQLDEQMLSHSQRLELLEEEKRVIEAISGLNGQLSHVREQQECCKEKERSLNVQISQLKISVNEEKEKVSENRRRMDYFEQRLKDQDKIWNDVYSAYDHQPEDEQIQVAKDKQIEESWDEIEAAFCGLKDAFEKEHTDLEDKRQLLESYEQSMERLVQLIKERGVVFDELEDMYEKGTLIPGTPQEIDQLRDELARLTTSIREMSDIAENVKADKNRLTGHVENAISAVEEKYGRFEAVDIKNSSYEHFVEEQEKGLAAVTDKLNQSCESVLRGSREIRAVEDIKKDLERLMRTARVTYNLTKDFYADGAGLRKRYEELCDQYERLKNEEHKKREAFEKNKDQLADLMLAQKSDVLADEIRYHMELPKNAEEAQALKCNIRETIQLICLEKDRIHQGISDMVRIRDSFIDQCLQRCLDIRTELERLPGLSKIILDGNQIPMIQLKIPYVREDFYKPRMTEYIDTIVKNTDAYTDAGDKLRYIRQKLAWKNLFSVIVTDMNSIRLNLYKRERVREQSRYLKYEEAVGSTGQSQGIYIQFLIAVINYISALYSRESDGTACGKVIFIDNPFGAAKDIYIWEPIFKLLKTNNVQMIVPARGATPAISGMFDVNYVLGQKMIDGKVQTVVVDYYSNIKIDEMEYVKIDFEQEVFDFI